MSDDTRGGNKSSLGGRLPLLTPATMTPRQRRLHATLAPAKRQEAARGGYTADTPEGALIGPFNSYFFVPEIADGYIAWGEALHQHLPFEPEVRETVILTVGSHWRAPFELYAHRAVARTNGLAPETVAALAAGQDAPGLSLRAALAQRFTRALVAGHDVADALYAEARQAFGDEGLVGLTYLIGLYLSVSAVLKAFRVPAPGAGG